MSVAYVIVIWLKKRRVLKNKKVFTSNLFWTSGETGGTKP